MLTSLCRRCIITDGSSRESVIEWLLCGGLLSVSKGLLALLLRYSSCIARRFRLRRKKNKPPAIAPIAAKPTTTPAAMPAVLGPFDGLCVSALAGAAWVWPGVVETKTVAAVAALVIVVCGLSLVESGCATGAAVLVGLLLAVGLEVVELNVDDGEAVALEDGMESELESEPGLESWALPTLLFSPVKDTDHLLSPPPTEALAMKEWCNKRTYICLGDSHGS